MPTLILPTMDRFLVLSLLEDLQFPPPPEDPLFPGESKKGKQTRYDELFVSSPTGLGGAGEVTGLNNSLASSSSSTGASSGIDEGLLTAGEQTDVAEESCERQLARVRAVAHLPALARKMGARWTSAELVPYLLRCCEEDCEALSFAVAKVLPSLLGLCTVASAKPPPKAVGNGMSHLFTAKSSEARDLSSDKRDLTAVGASPTTDAGDTVDDADAKRFTFSARSQKSLEASLSVSGELIAETIANTVYYEELPPTPPANGGQPPNPNAFVNSPSQHVITPDALAPVLVALSSVSSQLVRRYIADVTIPTVCFGVPFSIHYPLFSISSSGADWAKRGGADGIGGVGVGVGEDGGGGDGDSSGGAYSSLGAGKASVPMPANEINGPTSDGTDGFDMFARFMRISAEERAAMQRLGLFSGAGSNTLEANVDDVFFYRLLKVVALSSESRRHEGKGAGFSSENNVERETLDSVIKEWEAYRARRAVEGDSLAAPPTDPFSHSQRRGQLRAAIKGALVRQEKIFLPHSHAYVTSEEPQQQSEDKAVDRRCDMSSPSRVGLFNVVLRHLLLGGSGTTRTSLISGAGESFGMGGGGGSASPWPLHLSTAVRLIANLVRLLTSCAVFNVQSLCLALGKMSVSTTPTASSDSSSSSSLPSILPSDTSSAPYTPFEERMLLASFIQETVSLDDVVLPAINMVSTVLLDDRRGAMGRGNGDDEGEEREDIALATEDVYAKQPALARFLASSSSSSSKLSSSNSALNFIVDNPFVFSGSSSDLSIFSARKRLRYPISKEAINAFLETLMPALAIKSQMSSKEVEQLLLSVVGRRKHSDRIGYCCVPRLEFLISSATSHDTTTGRSSNSQGPSMILTAIRSSLLSASDVGGILFDLMALPIPTASAALPPPPSVSGGLSEDDDVGRLLYGSAMGTVALDALERRYEEHRRLMISLTRRGSGGGAGPTEDERNQAREVGEVVGALGGLLLGAGGGGGSVSRQPSMMPAHERVVGSGAPGGDQSSSPTSGSREAKTMFSIVASVRTSRSALEQVRKSLDSSTGGQGPPSSSSNAVCKERLQLLRSRSFGGHYYKTAALCCQAFCMVAKQYSYLSSLSIIMACGGEGGIVDNSNGVCGVSALQSVRASVANLTSLLFAASAAIISPMPYYLSWRSRYSGAVWMPSVASAVAMLTDRLACFSTCIVPALSGSAVSSPSSSMSSPTSMLVSSTARGVDGFGAGSRPATITGPTTTGSSKKGLLLADHPSLVLLRDALILWQNGGGVGGGAKRGGHPAGSEQRYPNTTDSSSSTLLSRLSASTAVLPLKVFIPSSDDYAELSTHFTKCVWPLVKRAQTALLSASRDLVFEELEEEVRVAALERLLVTPRPSPYGSMNLQYSDPFSGPVATSVMAMTAIVTPLAELRATIEEAGEERWRHDSHTRLRSSVQYTMRIPSLLPSSAEAEEDEEKTASATSSVIVTPFAAAAEILETTRLALGRSDGTGASGIVVVGGAVADAPANVSERTRAAVPLGITHLLAESWRCGLSISSFFAAEAATPSYPSASSSSVRSPIALYPFAGSLVGLLSPVTTGKHLGTSGENSSSTTALPPALRSLAMSISRQNEEDLRYVHFSLTEKSRVGMTMLATEYTGFRDACSRVLASLASDNGPLVQIGIVNAMLRLLASSPTASTMSGADGSPVHEGALLTYGNSQNNDQRYQTRQEGYKQPSMLDRAEMEVFVSETCARLVRSEVWRVREAFAPTLAKAVAAYVAPAVLLGVEALEGIVERSRQRKQQVDAGGYSSYSSTAGSGGALMSGGGSGEWTSTEARHYEKVFADVLGLSAPSGGGDGDERHKGKPTKTAAMGAEGGTSQALLLANYHFATTELLPMFVSLIFDKTKAVRDAATDAAARLAFTLRQASAAFDDWQHQHAGTAQNASMISMLPHAAEERSLAPHVEQFINNDLFTTGIVESPSASQHSYLMRVQLLTVAVTMGVEKTSILIPLLARFAKDKIVNVRMAVAKAIAALVKRQRAVEGTNAVTREAVLRIMRTAGRGAGAIETISQVTTVVPSPLASSGIRRGLLSIAAPTKSQLVGVGSTASDGSNANNGNGGNGNTNKENSFFAPPQRTLTDTAEREISNSPHPSLLTEELCFYYHFTKDEVEELLCANMLRPLLEDSSQDVRDLASKAFTACY